MKIDYVQLCNENFTEHSLDDFVRYQQVTECWRQVDGEWQLLPISFTEDWSLEQCRSIATDVAVHMDTDQTAIGAFDGNRLVGFITLSHDIFGTSAKYAEVVCFQVSEEYRGMGIGGELFVVSVLKPKRWGQRNYTFQATPQRKAKQYIRH